MDRKGIVILLTLGSVLALTGLYYYSLSIGPAQLPIGDLTEEMVGKWVETVGTVKEARLTSSGLVLRLMDPLDYSEVAVFASRQVYDGLEEREDVVQGAEVMVRGELQLYRGQLEILITSSKDLDVLRKAGG